MSEREPGRPARGRKGMLALGVFAAGALAGAGLEELLYRRFIGRSGPDDTEPVSHGEPVEVPTFDGSTIVYRRYGPVDAPVCVFLHGFTLSHEVWHYQLAGIEEHGRLAALTWDARGHGGSGPVCGPGTDTRCTAGTMARDLAAVLDAAEVRSCVLVGHSMGGMTVLQFAQDHPHELGSRVKGLVLLNTTFTGELLAWREGRPRLAAARRTLGGYLERFASDASRLDKLRRPASDMALWMTRIGFGVRPSPAHVALTRRMIDATGSATLAAGMIGLQDYDTFDVLQKIDVPTLVVAGSRDLITPAWLSREMASRIADAELVVYPGAGHMVMLERHEEFGDLLAGFLERTLL